MYSSLECIFFVVAKSCGKKEKETVAGRTEEKTEKRKSIKNAKRQHLGEELRRNKKKASLPQFFFLQFSLTKQFRFGRNSQFTDLSVHKLALTG